MSGAPLPATRTFLTELANVSAATKVRFLGWYYSSSPPERTNDADIGDSVISYDVSKAILVLEHRFPIQSSFPRAAVDVSMVLETIKAEDLRAGAWLNIIGYVHNSAKRTKETRAHNALRHDVPLVTVQAILLWNAGSLKVGDYEQALAGLKEAEARSSKMQ